MDKSFGIQFFLRKSTSFKNEKAPIYVRITINGGRVEISVKRTCDPEKWNVAAGRAIGKTDDVKQLNAYLNTFQQKIYEAKRKHLELDKLLTAKAIKNTFLGIEERGNRTMLLQVFAKHNGQMKALIGQEYAHGTWERFTTSYQHTQQFLKDKYRGGRY